MSSVVRAPLHHPLARNGPTAAVVTALMAAFIGGSGAAAVAVETLQLDAPASVVGNGGAGSVSAPVTPA